MHSTTFNLVEVKKVCKSEEECKILIIMGLNLYKVFVFVTAKLGWRYSRYVLLNPQDKRKLCTSQQEPLMTHSKEWMTINRGCTTAAWPGWSQ